MKKQISFKLSALCIGLISAWQNTYAADNTHTCNNQNYCKYLAIYESESYPNYGIKGYWTFTDNPNRNIDGQKIGLADDNFKFFIPVGNYTNNPITKKDENIFSTIIYANRDVGNGTAHITIPSGVTATQSSGGIGSSIIAISNMDGVIEDNVLLTLNPSYEELNGEYLYNSSRAIYISNYLTEIQDSPDINVTTSADIVLNAESSIGIEAKYNATVFANNHSITMNGEYNTAIETSINSSVTANNVSITGNNSQQVGIDVSDKYSVVRLNDSYINFDEKYISTAIKLRNGKVELNDSKVNALFGIFADAFGNDNAIYNDSYGFHNVVNLTNSTLIGNYSLVDVNPETYGYNVSRLTEHSTTINAENSSLYGAAGMKGVYQNTPDWFKSNISMTLKESQWTLNHDSELNILDSSNSNIYFESAKNRFLTLTLNDLIGTGSFSLNTDLANQQSDKIIVKGSDSGSFGLNIKDSGNEPNAANGKVTLVETATGTAQFALLGKGYVDAGAYRYRLNQDSNNWVLSNQAGEQASSSTSANQGNSQTGGNSQSSSSGNQGNSQSSTNVGSNVGTGSGSTEAPQVVLSEKSNALVSLRQAQLALVESNLEGLHQRLGELKNSEKGNVWVRNINSRNDFTSTRTASNSYSSGFEQDVHTVQLGADAALTDNIRLGGFIGNARSDVDFDGEYGSGEVKTQSLGLYGTYLANNGFYWDSAAKYEYVKSESVSTGKRKYNAYTLSTEIGRIH